MKEIRAHTEGIAGGDTIVAISTAPGTGAIGIVRMSGPAALKMAEEVFSSAQGILPGESESHRLLYGHARDPEDGRVVDEVLLAVMHGPATYTREDLVEFHCHGGAVAQRELLRLFLRLGARPAEPGEFTRRAFLGGRIDLAQAESVAGIVEAQSAAALRASVNQLRGGLSARLQEIRSALVGALAELEARIDFSDEDIDEVDREVVASALRRAGGGLDSLLETAFLGRALREGVRTVIVGKPNVGKSSLLNALLMRERAIVSELPGTTRDTVEETLEVGGIPLHLVDTAGMRISEDLVEKLGVERSEEALEGADLILAVVDASHAVDEEDIDVLRRAEPGRTVVIGNKWDLVEGAVSPAWGGEGLPAAALAAVGGAAVGGSGEQWRTCLVSALDGEGLEELRNLIEEVVTESRGLDLEEPVLATERQRNLVQQAARYAGAAAAGLEEGVPDELVSEDVREAISALGRITGEDLGADLVEEIFSRFCIGK